MFSFEMLKKMPPCLPLRVVGAVGGGGGAPGEVASAHWRTTAAPTTRCSRPTSTGCWHASPCCTASPTRSSSSSSLPAWWGTPPSTPSSGTWCSTPAPHHSGRWLWWPMMWPTWLWQTCRCSRIRRKTREMDKSAIQPG